MKPYQQFNHRMNELYRLNINRKPSFGSQKVYYYRKGRIPTIAKEMQQHGYICRTETDESSLKFSNDPHRVSL
jgi:hypothetical protein